MACGAHKSGLWCAAPCTCCRPPAGRARPGWAACVCSAALQGMGAYCAWTLRSVFCPLLHLLVMVESSWATVSGSPAPEVLSSRPSSGSCEPRSASTAAASCSPAALALARERTCTHTHVHAGLAVAWQGGPQSCNGSATRVCACSGCVTRLREHVTRRSHGHTRPGVRVVMIVRVCYGSARLILCEALSSSLIKPNPRCKLVAGVHKHPHLVTEGSQRIEDLEGCSVRGPGG